MENEKTQFTPEDVGRMFETSEDGVTATVVKFDVDDKKYPVLIEFSNGFGGWHDTDGNSYNRVVCVFPSRPVEEAPSQPTIDTEVEELARELFVLLIQNKNLHTERVLNDSFDYAEQFIKFRNERRASHGK